MSERTEGPREGQRWGGSLGVLSVACFGPRVQCLTARDVLGAVLLLCLLALGVAPLLALAFPSSFTHIPERLPELALVLPSRALKEEILFRGLPFFFLVVRGRMGARVFVALSAVVFVVAHEINFRWLQGDPLSPSTLVTLFFFGLLTGALFVRQGHLLGCLALHAGWNVARFQLDMSDASGNIQGETAGFGMLEGSPALMAVTGLWAVFLWQRLPASRRPSERLPTPAP